MIEIVPFKKEHALVSEIKEEMTRKFFTPDDEYLERMENWNTAFCAVNKEGVVIGCAGIMPMWKGVGEAWSFLTEEIKNYPFTLHKAVKRGLEIIINEHNYHRVQMNVVLGFKDGERWAERLGFVYESTLPMYGPNKEHYSRWVILNP